MTIVHLKTDGPIGLVVDALSAGLPETDKTTEPMLRRVAAIYDDAAKVAKETSESRELTALGKTEAIRRSLVSAYERLAPHEAETERLKLKAEATRARALDRREIARDLAVEREIRDRLMADGGDDQLMVSAQYLSAIEQGDYAFVFAVESAPVSFPLINADTRRKGEDAKLAISPLRWQLDTEENDYAVHRQIGSSVRAELGKLAQDIVSTW